MTNVTWRTITSRRREWIVPSAPHGTPSWGACLGDIRDGLAMAAAQYRRDHDKPEDSALSDDALRLHVTDDEIVISYVIENDERTERAQAAQEPPDIPEPQQTADSPPEATQQTADGPTP